MNRMNSAVKDQAIVFFPGLSAPDQVVRRAVHQIEQHAQFNAIEPTIARKMLAAAAYSADNADEGHVQLCLATLEEGRVRYVAEDHDRRIIIKMTGLPRVEYFPAKNRWRVAGNPKKQHGTADQLVKWIKESVR